MQLSFTLFIRSQPTRLLGWLRTFGLRRSGQASFLPYAPSSEAARAEAEARANASRLGAYYKKTRTTMTTKCKKCHRTLTAESSMLNGLGPVCAAKELADAATTPQEEQPVLHTGDVREAGLICRRLPDGRVACNVEQRIIHHSPTGFEIGYAGSGPADLALNVMAMFFPGNTVALWRGECSEAAWDLHQKFKERYIATMPREGGDVPLETIKYFIAKNLTADAA